MAIKNYHEDWNLKEGMFVKKSCVIIVKCVMAKQKCISDA